MRIHLGVNYNPTGASRGVEGEKEEGARRKEEEGGRRRREEEGGGGRWREEEGRGGRKREEEGGGGKRRGEEGRGGKRREVGGKWEGSGNGGEGRGEGKAVWSLTCPVLTMHGVDSAKEAKVQETIPLQVAVDAQHQVSLSCRKHV